jgi:hypothetical protein
MMKNHELRNWDARAREYFWFARVLIVLVMGSAARAGTPDDGAPSDAR